MFSAVQRFDQTDGLDVLLRNESRYSTNIRQERIDWCKIYMHKAEEKV